MIFPRPAWEQFRERIAAMSLKDQWLKRLFLGNAMDVDMDGTGRVLVSPELRAAANISRDALLLGMGSHFEHVGRTVDAADAERAQARHTLDGGSRDEEVTRAVVAETP